MTTARAATRRQPVVAVGVDGSAVSLAALEWAAHDAGLRDAALRVVTAWNVLPPSRLIDAPHAWTNEQLQQACGQMVDDALASVDIPPNIAVERVVQSGRPAQVLEDAAAGTDLLVVGGRGCGRFSKLMLGSVSASCAQRAKRPVVVVREAQEIVTSRPVVCGVGESAEAGHALLFAADEARLRAVPLVALHAVHWDLRGIDLIRPNLGQLHDWGRQLLAKRIGQVLGTARRTEVEMRTVEGRPADVLVDQSRDAALLVVGTRARSAVEMVLLGSVDAHCLRNAQSPIAVVASRDDRLG